jgi:hypothetical protein
MAVTGHTVMSDSACRASALGASVVASATASATRALLNPPTYVLVYSTADLPAAVAGVITLAANTTYVITTTVDLAGARLVCSANTAIIGGSSENCRIKSTGLGASPLITSAYSLPMRNVSIEATIALALDATGNLDQALDWTGVNFINTPTIGTIRGYGNVVLFAAQQHRGRRARAVRGGAGHRVPRPMELHRGVGHQHHVGGFNPHSHGPQLHHQPRRLRRVEHDT